MNLGKLLGVGKSFFGADPMAAYRLNKRACLPKFNEGRNPFAPKTAAAAANAPAVSVSPKAEVTVPTPVNAQPKKIPAYANPPKIAQAAPPPVVKPARPGWTTRLNPFRAPEADLAQPPRVVQPEFTLDTVKVVHNDLADADVEIVPVKAHAEVPPAILPPARQAWEYLGEHMLKSS
jgi:hypothetical protein